MRTGFCSRLNPPDSHDRCPVVLETKPCECACHDRFGVIWLDWMGEAQSQGGFRAEDDADLAGRMLKRLLLIPEDAPTDVVPYRVGEEWLA